MSMDLKLRLFVSSDDVELDIDVTRKRTHADRRSWRIGISEVVSVYVIHNVLSRYLGQLYLNFHHIVECHTSL